MTPIPSPEISHRSDFSLLCNARGLTKKAIEVGTDRAEFAVDFLSRWQGELLTCIDNYQTYDERPYPRECDRMMAVLALQKHWPRAKIIELPSIEAAIAIPKWDLPVDFVYIDGAHDYENVARDIRTYSPLLSDRGIIAGHDYDTDHPGVMKAVNEFAQHRPVYLTNERLASWYFYRNEPDIFVHRYFRSGVSKNVKSEPEEKEL